MPKLSDAVSTAFDELTGTGHSAATTPAATVDTPETSTESQGSESNDETNEMVELNQESSTETKETTPTLTTSQNVGNQLSDSTKQTGTPPVDTGDLESIKASILAAHPELEPVVTAKFREVDKVLNKKLEQYAALRKDAAEQVVRDERLKSIPEDEIAGFTQLYHVINHGTSQDKINAADYLFELQEELRGSANMHNTSTQQSIRDTPEWQEIKNFQQQQALQQLQQQLDSEYTKLKSEYGGQDIPKHQREEVEDIARAKNLSVGDIPMIWRSLYGFDYAKQEGIRKGQQLRKDKEGLGVGNTGAPPPSPMGVEKKPKSVRDAVSSVCDSRGIR